MALIGYDLRAEPSPAPTLAVTLYWRVMGKLDQPYTVFVHLVDDRGQLLGQGDGPPLAGDYRTDRWSPGELLADTHVVAFPEALGAEAHLLVGLYGLADGTRLPVYATAGERVQDDAIRIDLKEP